jgi:hypothetical protein
VARHLIGGWFSRNGAHPLARLFSARGEAQAEHAALAEHASDDRAQPFRDSSGGLLDAVLQELDHNQRLEQTRQEEPS